MKNKAPNCIMHGKPLRIDLGLVVCDECLGTKKTTAKPIDAGLRYKPVLERAPHRVNGWTAEMEQAHDGEWIHISTVMELIGS